MRHPNITDFKDSTKYFVSANTPTYLYKHLGQLQEVESLSNKFSAEELHDICKQIEREEKNRDNELKFYIFLTALSFKIYSESSKYLNDLKTTKYKWANSIIELIVAKTNIIIFDTIDVKNKPKIIVEHEPFGNTSTSDISINIENKGEYKND